MRYTMALKCCAGRTGASDGRGRALVVGGSPGGGCRFRRGGSGAAEVAWAGRRGRARGQPGVIRWSVTAVTAWLPAMALVEPLHGLTFALLRLACMQMLSAVAPPALAATAGYLRRRRRRYDDRYNDTRVRPALWCIWPAGVLVHGAALRGCIADCVRNARISFNASGSKPIQPAPR